MVRVRRKPSVAWPRACPKCRQADALKVRQNGSGLCFWYCGKDCGWAGWRPPALDPCPECGGVMFWACSRRSIGCAKCQVRVYLVPPGRPGRKPSRSRRKRNGAHSGPDSRIDTNAAASEEPKGDVRV